MSEKPKTLASPKQVEHCPVCKGHGYVEKLVGGGHFRRFKCEGPCGGYSTIHGRVFGETKK